VIGIIDDLFEYVTQWSTLLSDHSGESRNPDIFVSILNSGYSLRDIWIGENKAW